MFEYYDKIPWKVRAANPILLVAAVILHFHSIYNFNLMEFLGFTFSVVSSFYWAFHSLVFVYRNWIGVALGKSLDLSKLKGWAVVTGATQGIGLSYAHALAKKGLNVVLLSRSLDKLSQTAQEISETHNVNVKIIPIDFTGGADIYDEVAKELKDIPVGILVNNVGMCYSYPEYFGDLQDGRNFCRNVVNCNILSLAMMTNIVLPGMVERKQGVVVNVGSMSCILDAPFLSLYGASKTFLDKFTSELELEYRDMGILFQNVMPGYVVGPMSKIKQSSIWVPTADEFVEKAIAAIGLQSRTAVWIPHQILHFSVRIGHFFRRAGATEVSRIIWKQIYLYGKKIRMSKNGGKLGEQNTNEISDYDVTF